MKPREYELFVGDYFRQQGYEIEKKRKREIGV